MSGNVKQWQGEVEALDGRLELGPAAHLFEASTAVFAASLQVVIGNYDNFDPDSYRILRNEFRRFYLWNEGFSTSSEGDWIGSYRPPRILRLPCSVSWFIGPGRS